MEYRLKAEEWRLERFNDLGIPKALVEEHLGHPFEQATATEIRELEDYLERTEAERRRNPKYIPRPLPTKQALTQR